MTGRLQGKRALMAFLFDAAALERYLSENLQEFAGPIEVRAFSEGQSNPTFLLETPKKKYVLRKKPPGVLPKSAHAVDREYRVQRALWDTDVPVAEVLHLCEDEAIIGTIFYVMEFLEGRIFWDPAVLDMQTAERGAIYELPRVFQKRTTRTQTALLCSASCWHFSRIKQGNSEYRHGWGGGGIVATKNCSSG